MAGLASEAAASGGAEGPHFRARAKRVIRLFMQGGPSHVDTFDYKPELITRGGQTAGVEQSGVARVRKNDKLLAPLWNQLVIACEFGCRRRYVKAAFAPDYDSSHVLLT